MIYCQVIISPTLLIWMLIRQETFSLMILTRNKLLKKTRKKVRSNFSSQQINRLIINWMLLNKKMRQLLLTILLLKLKILDKIMQPPPKMLRKLLRASITIFSNNPRKRSPRKAQLTLLSQKNLQELNLLLSCRTET